METRSSRAFTAALALGLVTCATPRPAAVVLSESHQEPDVSVTRHRVEAGQTAYRIARTYGISVDELLSANSIDDPTAIAVGTELVIPGASAPRPVVAADSPEPEPPARPVPTVKQKPVAVGKKDGVLAWPLRGVLYARFGKKGTVAHDGIDLAAPAGSPIASSADGTVLFAGEQHGYGLIAIVEHAGGLATLYAHNRELKVKTGQAVRAGQTVATVGDSGRTSGPHLHFEVRKDGSPVDPLEYLGPVPKAAEPGLSR